MFQGTTPSYDKLWLSCTATLAGTKSYVAEVSENQTMSPIVSSATTNNTLPTGTAILNLIEGRAYYWRVTAFSAINGTGSVLGSTSVGGPTKTHVFTPDPVKGLQFNPSSATSVTASWNSPVPSATTIALRLYNSPLKSAVDSPGKVVTIQGVPFCPPKGSESLPGSVNVASTQIPGITSANRLFFGNAVSYRCDGPGVVLNSPAPTFVAGGIPFPTPTTPVEFTANVMSFNTMLQKAADADPNQPGSWSTRLPILASQAQGADIIGAQELQFVPKQVGSVLDAMDLANAIGLTVAQKGTLTAPVPCYTGQDGYGTSEPILYNANKYTLQNCGGDIMDAANDQDVSWAVFKDIKSGQPFLVLNAHLVYGDAYASVRAKAAQALVTLIDQYRADPSIGKDLPIIMTGDFNSYEAETPTDGSISPATIVEQGAGLIGADWTAAQRTNITYPSMIDWRNPSSLPQFGQRIDHILLDQNSVANTFETVVPATVSTNTMGSDHAPIKATITVHSYASLPSGPVEPPKPACDIFPDVPSSYTFYSSICWLVQNKITSGMADGTYAPTRVVNRGSMAAFLYRLAGSPKWTPPTESPFVDVTPSDQFYSAITWLASTGITKGTMINGKLYYEPGNAVNRGSMAAFMYRLSGSPKWSPPATSPFVDLNQTNQFYSSITWMAANKITYGSVVNGQTVYQPGNPVNRGSMAAFLKRLADTKFQCTNYPKGVGC